MAQTIKLPYQIGDEVMVRCEEGEDFRAQIVGINLDQFYVADYTLEEESGQRIDGYTESWLYKGLTWSELQNEYGKIN